MLKIKKLIFFLLALSLIALPAFAQTTSKKLPSTKKAANSSLDLPVGGPQDLSAQQDPEEIDEEEPPKLYDEDLPMEELSIIYVVDISGSMWCSCPDWTGLDGNVESGNRLDRAKVELVRSISALTENYTFNIIAYHCAMRQWRPTRDKATPPNKADASAWVMALHPGGGTGTGPAAALALADKDNYTVALLSDGWPGCMGGGMAAHLQMILASDTQGAQVHTFGINTYGSAEQFLRDVATNTGGTYFPVQ
jgi:hypothetical protein